MNKQTFSDKLAQGVLVFDGGMGTQLMAAGLPAGACGVAWNVEQADAVAAIHQRYINAGCQIVTTNTFQASRVALGHHGLAERTAELNRAGAAVARQAAGEAAMVAADIGPFGGFLEPLGDTTPDELTAIFNEQLTAMHEGGADLALIETMSDPAEVAVAIAAAKQVADWPVVVTFTYQAAGDVYATMMGTSVEQACTGAIEAGADVIGTNCGTALDLDDYARLAEMLVAAAGDVPVILQPNAGAPIERDGELHHPATPDDMAKLAVRLRCAGVRLTGGCCGTTPDHLKAMSEALGANV